MKEIVKEYFYTDEDYKKIYEAIRYKNPKSFTQHKIVDGIRLKGMENVKYVPYNLPNVVKSDIVYFVEGEKDVDNLNTIGLVATTTIGGASSYNKHKDDYIKYFKGKTVYIIPDNDEAGKKYASSVMESLKDIVKFIKILDLTKVLPDLKEKGDISDVLEMYGKEQTIEIIDSLKKIYDFSNYSGKHINLEMLKEILKELHISIKYNEITKENEISGISSEYSAESAEDTLPALISDLCINNKIKYKEKDIRDELLLISDSNRYNPIKEMLTKNKWDGQDRFPLLYEIIGIENDKLSQLFVRKWLWQTAIIPFNENIAPFGIDGVLVFQGPQGCGKTRCIRNLSLKPDWFKEGAVIDLNVKDSIIGASKGWIVELR